jgi:hypothetical protein
MSIFPHRKPPPAAVSTGVGSTVLTAPTVTDPSIAAAAADAQAAAAAAAGRMSTVLTSGLGDTSPATVSKKTLLGQ